MRPVYETEKTLDMEADLARRIEAVGKCKLKKLPRFYQVDFAAVRGKAVVGWFELKCRSNAHDAYPTYMLSLHKWEALKKYAATAPSYLVVGFSDGVWFTDVSAPAAVEIGGRSDRGDEGDVEPVVQIDISKFKKLEGALN